MTYYTREQVHVDRIASAWLIRRYVDQYAEFRFIRGDQTAEGTPFDLPGAELGHRSDFCTFEAILAKYGLKTPGLEELATLIHATDILADSDQALESAGLDLAFKAIRLACETDAEALEFGFKFMDGLLTAVQDRIRRIT